MHENELLQAMMEDENIKLRLNELKKEEQKYWNNHIESPIGLSEALRMLTRDELHEIRKYLGIKGVSQLKKAELVDLFTEKIPEYLSNICRELDDERFHLLVRIARNNGVLHLDDFKLAHVRYYRSIGILFTGKLDGEKVVILPVELIEPILSLERNLSVRSVIKRNTEWIDLTTGLLHYYGTLTIQELEELLPKYTKEPIHHDDLVAVIHGASDYYRDIFIDDYGYSHMDVQEPDVVRQEQSIRENLSFYPFTKAQILKASNINFVERNQSYMQLVDFILQNYEISEEEADSIVEDCVFFIQQGISFGELMNFLSESLEIQTKEQVRAFGDKVVYLMNNTRKWHLKGYTSSELSRRDNKPSQQSFPIKRQKTVKIGRNDPCPCGSGKKYKKCCLE